MKNIPAVRVASRSRLAEPAWEIAARYAAAYACTFIAIAGAQLIIPTSLALFLAAIAALGLPLSLNLRTMLAQPQPRISRVNLNRIFVVLTFLACFLYVRLSMPLLFTGMGSRLSMFFDTGRSIPMLMEIFLVFAVCRCLVIVSDKDAIHSALPAFCVLLLLIVVHKGPEVVGYFLAWTAATAVLFALDHRQESRHYVSGFVPAVLPGQEAALSARSLIAVLSLSLFFASLLSYVVVNRQPVERGQAENLIIEWASRLTQLSDFVPDASVNGGPERQIDFSSGPALPTRTPLWRVQVFSAETGRRYQPDYFRMFTLARYDGRTWSQTSGTGVAVPLGPLSWRSWPLFVFRRRSRVFPNRELTQAELTKRAARQKGYEISDQIRDGERRMALYGTPRIPVGMVLYSLDDNLGYLPVLPAVRALQMRAEPANVRVRDDGAIDVGVVEKSRRTPVLVASEVPPLPEYGAPGGGVPARTTEQPNPGVRLSAAERKIYLQLPKQPARVREFAVRALRGAAADESNWRRAQRLAEAIQSVAVYTLRPSATPENRDAVDYFLFESRRGYCTYFASALTALCRSQGIPARIVSGFTNAEWISEPGNRHGIIREANAHAWTEVWVPGWGWATVDATPPDDRGDNAASFWDNIQNGASETFASVWAWIRANMLLCVVGLVALVLAAVALYSRGGYTTLLAWLRARRRRRRGERPRSEDDLARLAVIETYGKAARLLARHYRRRAPWETSHEWFAAGTGVLVPQSAEPLQTLAELYTRASYSLKPLANEEAEAASRAFSTIEWRQSEREKNR